MSACFDPNITATRRRIVIRFRKEKLDEPKRVEAAFIYKTKKILERYKETIASDPILILHDQDRDNIVKNLITGVLSFDCIEIDNLQHHDKSSTRNND